MLRTIFVLLLSAIGVGSIFTGGAFNALLYYLWIAHFRPEAWVWTDFIQSLNLSLIAGGAVVFVTIFSRERFRLTLRSGLLLAFLAQSLISTMMSPHSSGCWPYFIDFAKSTLMTYLITTMVTDFDRFRRVVLIISLSLGFEAVKQGWVGLLLSPGTQNINDSVTLGDNNGVAVGMMMLLGLVVALIGTATRRWERIGYQVMALGILYRGVSTYSRGGALGCLALLVWYVFRSKQKFLAVVSLVLACGVILPILPTSFWDRMSTIGAATDNIEDADGSIRGRLNFWSSAVAMANARPFLGVGHNGFTFSYNEYDETNGAFGENRSVHNSWLGVLAELGYPGFVLFAATIALAFTACFRARRVAARGGPKCLENYAFGLELGLVGFSVAGSFVIFQYTELLWHCIGLSAALHTLAVQADAALKARRPEGPVAIVAAGTAA